MATAYGKNKKPCKYRPVTHCIFDLDGTILDTEHIYRKIMSEIAHSYGKRIPVNLFQRQLGTTTVVASNMVVNELELPITTDEYAKKLRAGVKKNIQKINLRPGAEKLILHLHEHKIPIALATSSAKESTCLKLSNFPHIFYCFHHFVCGGTELHLGSKPAPDIYLDAAKRFCGKPAIEKCLVFEDAVNGVYGATHAGMQVVMTPDPSLSTKSCELATKVIRNLCYFKPEEFGLPPYKKSKCS